jgi:hypothetical protein
VAGNALLHGGWTCEAARRFRREVYATIKNMVSVRAAEPGDLEAIWSILEPVIRAGETYMLSRDLSREDALAYWFSEEFEVFVATEDGRILGTYHLEVLMWRTAAI